jgi:hypothetical protein
MAVARRLHGGVNMADETDGSRSERGEAVAVPREAADGRSSFDRAVRGGVIVQHPAVEHRTDAIDGRADPGTLTPFGAVERRLREEARLDGVRLASREVAHLLNNDLAVAVGCIDLLQAQIDLPPHLAELIRGAARSLDAAALHIEQLQRVSQVVVKETPAGPSLDLERSRGG